MKPAADVPDTETCRGRTRHPARAAAVAACVCAALSCAGHAKKARFPAAHETVRLNTIERLPDLSNLPGWPQDSVRQRLLYANFTALWHKMKDELIRCEKYGLYRTIDTSQDAVIEVDLLFGNPQWRNDSLCLDVTVRARSRISGEKREEPHAACGFGGTPGGDDTHRLNAMLADLARRFPVHEAAAMFY